MKKSKVQMEYERLSEAWKRGEATDYELLEATRKLLDENNIKY